MLYREVSGKRVSAIGFGCAGFWGQRRFSESQAVRLIHEAVALGINHFDTGHNYSNYNAEPRLGRALADLVGVHGRSNFFISSKAGTVRGSPFDRRPQNLTPDYIETACAKSLSNLGVECLDVFYLHSIGPHHITDDLLSRLSSMRRRGMFRLLGVNTHTPEVMRHIAGLGGTFDVALIDFNVAQLDRIAQIEMLCGAGIVVVTGNILAQGHLIAGKIGRIRSLADVYYLARATLSQEAKNLSRASRTLQSSLAKVSGMSAAQAAMAYALAVPGISSCIFGTTSLRNLTEIVGAANKTMFSEDRAAIESAYRSLQS